MSYKKDYTSDDYKCLDLTKITKFNIENIPTSLKEFFNKNKIPLNYLDNKISNIIKKYGELNRVSLIKVIEVISLNFENEFGFNLPYTYNGWHGNKTKPDFDLNNYGYFFEEINDFDELSSKKINLNTGIKFDNKQKQRYRFRKLVNGIYEDDYIYESYGPDCSGLILWAFRAINIPIFNKNTIDMVMGYVNKQTKALIYPLGIIYYFNHKSYQKLKNKTYFKDLFIKFNKTNYFGKPGDLIWRPGHILIITDIDLKNNLYYTTESKGSGVGVIRSCISLTELQNNIYCLINIDPLLKDYAKVLKTYYLK